MTDTERKHPRHWSKRWPEGMDTNGWDTIVIGSGIGGMTAAAMLAKLGQRVLVLEQHYVPGGYTHVFTRKGYTWDVGVHAVGEVSEHSLTGRLLTHLTDGELRWSTLGPVYDEFFWPDGFRIDFPDRPDTFRQNLIDAFPDEVDAIDGYLAMVREVSGAMKGYYLARITPERLFGPADWLLGRSARKYMGRTTAEVIAELTDNPRLRAVFAAQWGYYGSTPSRSSFAMQALVVKHFQWGAYYPEGGSAEIARGLLHTVAKAGGWTRIVADVAQILIEDGRAAGVRLTDGEEIRAKRVVSAAGVVSTVQRLLPEELREQEWGREVRTATAASAHLCLYLGFKGDISKAGASAANKWFYDTWDMEMEAWDVNAQPLGTPPCLYCSFPSLKDPHHDPGPEQRHTGEVVTFVRWDDFERWSGTRWRKRGEGYDELKQRLHDVLLERFLQQMPGLAPLLDYSELSTPVSTETFVRPVRGSIYGVEPTPQRFANKWLRPGAPVKDLFFAGSEVTTVGVIGALMGGVLAAAAVDPRGAWNMMKGLNTRR